MTQIVLNIEDDKLNTFMEFIKTLNYVTVSKEDAVPQWQIDKVESRLHKINSGEMKTRPWNEARTDIFKK